MLVVENIIKSIDMDGNGVIDYNEFLNCTMNRNKILSFKRKNQFKFYWKICKNIRIW